ncbi:MAG: M42 family metallopeptidase [Chloroflexi bacterium]|nr:M42 family metallopeptidase [Chloroflexota bacterium]
MVLLYGGNGVKELIKRLTESYGPSGREEQVRDVIRQEINGLADAVRIDALGNLIAVRKSAIGQGRRIMLAAHMDEIGVIVTHVDQEGFLRFSGIGGVGVMGLAGNRVQFADGTLGTINLEGHRDTTKTPKITEFYIDIGAGKKEDVKLRVGDMGMFANTCAEVGDRLIAKAMDDRLGCAVLIQTLRELKASPHEVVFTFTVQEEVGVRGAQTAAFAIEPEIALAVDVTPAGDMPEATRMTVSLGAGPAIKVKDTGMLAHPQVVKAMTAAAERGNLPFQYEVLEGGGTDAEAIQVSREGVLAGALSIPTRYVHSVSEMVDYRDVLNSVRLLVELLSRDMP